MSQINHMYDEKPVRKMCHHCKKEYLQTTEEQMAGFREKDYDVCPYCGKTNGSSMQVEYFNETIDEYCSE